MKRLNPSNKYICECGREFTNPQSFNGHKSHCNVHQIAKHGSLEYIEQVQQNIGKKNLENASIKRQEREQEKLLTWISEKHTCEKCGKVMTEKYGSGRFCSRKCANSHVITSETKNKISNKLLENGRKNFREPKHCLECGSILSKKNKSGLCSNCFKISDLAKEVRIAAGKNGYETKLKNGTHHGWQSRSKISYAERFWMDVLNNNGIMYEHEATVRKEDGINNYFLDFLIEINDCRLDLEIDGKQHKYKDRLASDKIRDAYLSSIGYTIYRIDWNEIISDNGKLLMKQKIDNFLEYYNNL